MIRTYIKKHDKGYEIFVITYNKMNSYEYIGDIVHTYTTKEPVINENTITLYI